MTEFEVIKKYFTNIGYAHNTRVSDELSSTENTKDVSVMLGIGDDCALLNVEQGTRIAVSTDTFLEGQHFFKGTHPYSIGYKALAVNLSDLAAMGAKPLGFTLALTLPEINHFFLQEFANGLQALANKYAVPLIGGDTTKGPLSITITIFGSVNPQREFRRDLAQQGDYICVTGALGGAAFAVRERYQSQATLFDTINLNKEHCGFVLDFPEPRFDSAQALKDVNCRVGLDISDGLAGDLQHILDRSHVSAVIDWEAIPKHSALCSQNLTVNELEDLVLRGGDDYELCVTLSKENYQQYVDKSMIYNYPKLYKIGEVISCNATTYDGVLLPSNPNPTSVTSEENLTQDSTLYLRQASSIRIINGRGFMHF